jgi:signal transduction histidine kinase
MLGVLPQKGRRMLDIAVSNTDRLVRLINDILDIERMESGKITMEMKDCAAADLLTQAMDMMREMAGEAGVTLSPTTHPAQLYADHDRILQTLTNLLGNAIKFSQPGGTVWLTAKRQGDEMRFQVEDQGRGIPADKLDSIFERFQQVDASDSREKGGTGLGLAICRSIVQQHDGKIWAESMVGKGSTFSFTLPVQRRAEMARSDVTSTTPGATPSLNDGAPQEEATDSNGAGKETNEMGRSVSRL